MGDNSSHYEYLAKYVDDILIWSKDPMAVIMSLENPCVKECRHSRVLFRWKCGIPWRSMEDSGTRISNMWRKIWICNIESIKIKSRKIN
jgi:hypothetical protein